MIPLHGATTRSSVEHIQCARNFMCNIKKINLRLTDCHFVPFAYRLGTTIFMCNIKNANIKNVNIPLADWICVPFAYCLYNHCNANTID